MQCFLSKLPAPRRFCIAPIPPRNSSKLPSLGSFPVGREAGGGPSALSLQEGVGSVTALDALSSPFSGDANIYMSALLWDVVAQGFSSAFSPAGRVKCGCRVLVSFLSSAELCYFLLSKHCDLFCSFVLCDTLFSFFKISCYLQIHLSHFPTHWSDGKAIHIIFCHFRVV